MCRFVLLFAATLCRAATANETDGAKRAQDAPPADHWAFQPPRASPPPATRFAAWCRNSIDGFVAARLEEEGLSPSPPADRRTLIRRAYFDLLGLPPSVEEVDRFVRDDAPDAFPRLVDRLLARREYGERWGRHWLDVARYSDTKGYVDSGERLYPFAYSYRDWVIDALNRDLPYDVFVRRQIAADRYASEPGSPALAALGFLTVGQRFNFFPHEIIDDRIDVIGRGLLALTIACARCHDHKYDPISSADYYALYGVFASSYEPSPDEFPVIRRDASERTETTSVPDAVREKAEAYKKRRRELHERIQHELRAWAGDYLRYIVQTDAAHRTVAQPPLRTERGLLREVTAYGPGGVGRWRRFIASRGWEDRVFGLWNRLVSLSREGLPREAEQVLTELAAARSINPLVAAAFDGSPPRSMVDVANTYGRLLEETETLWQSALGENPELTRLPDPDREELREVLHGRDAPATMTLDASEDLYHLDEHTDVRSRFAAIERAFLESGAHPPRAMVLHDRPSPVTPRIFLRGDPENPGARVPRRFPVFLAAPDAAAFRDGSGRRELAEAVASAENPLTARVIVNRIWRWHFGRGLVETPSDFGVRSEPPSHPALLDDLTVRFVADGWSLKRLHRRILLSATWQQASDDRPDCRRVDPENRLYWSMPRRRLEFEAMRDALLAVSGRLIPWGGGPPLDEVPGDPSGRHRTVYALLDRERLPELLRVFDFPSPDLSAPCRSRTTVPQQALFLLNSPFMIAQAEALAEEIEETADARGREAGVRELFRRVHGRGARADELELALAYLDERSAAEATPAARSVEPSPWYHGYGELDVERGTVTAFEPLPRFTGEAWQGGARWPDTQLHYLRLTARGGHAGIDRAHAAVRRWLAPRDGTVRVEGRLVHGVGGEECGDGVRAWITSSRDGVLGAWTAARSAVETPIAEHAVGEGDAIDFIVDCNENHLCDVFEWAPIIRYARSDAAVPERRRAEWDAAKDFGASIAAERVLSPWTELALSLLQSNEFLFVD